MLGIIAFLATVIQIMLMLVRGGMLVLLVGTLPLVAAFSNTEMGMQWFRKAGAWLVAFALYKPAAAIVYAVAFDLAGQPGALALLDGVMMLVLAILALPALLRFVVPATERARGRRRSRRDARGRGGRRDRDADADRSRIGRLDARERVRARPVRRPVGCRARRRRARAAAGMNGGAGQSGASRPERAVGRVGQHRHGRRRPAQHRPVALALRAALARLEAARRAAVREQPAQRSASGAGAAGAVVQAYGAGKSAASGAVESGNAGGDGPTGASGNSS